MTLSAQLWGHSRRAQTDMTLPTQVRLRSRPAKANVLGQQKLGCQETERDLNESSESAPHSIILPVYLDAFASLKEARSEIPAQRANFSQAAAPMLCIRARL
jgi:hypothetical protein